jgi:hypothetical protein
MSFRSAVVLADIRPDSFQSRRRVIRVTLST